MEGKRENRGGWWVVLFSWTVIVVLVIGVMWRRAVIEEGTINGERPSKYVDRMVELQRARSTGIAMASLAGEEVTIDPKGLVTLLKMAGLRPTRSEAIFAKYRGVLPSKIANQLPDPAKPALRMGVVLPLILEAANRSRTNGNSLFLRTLASLPQGDLELLGPVVYAMGRPTETEDPTVEAIADRLLLSRDPKVLEFAVVLKTKVFRPKAPPGPIWIKTASQLVRGATNFAVTFVSLPDYLRRANVDDASAKPLLLELSKSREEGARVAAKLELWRRFPNDEPVAQRAKHLLEEDGEPGFLVGLQMLRSEFDSGRGIPLRSVEELIVAFHRMASSGLLPGSTHAFSGATGSRAPTALSYYRSHFYQHPLPVRFNGGRGANVTMLSKPWAPQLQGRATNMVAVLKDKQVPRSDRLAMADLLQSLPSEQPEVFEVLVQGLEDKSLGFEALRFLGKYGSRITNGIPHLDKMLDSNVFPEREAAAAFFQRAAPANPALLDRWINGIRDPAIQAIAAEALGDYGPAASKSAPVLSDVVASGSGSGGIRELRLSSIASLRKIRPEYSVVSAALMKALNDKPGVRLHAEIVSAAKAAILDLAPADHPDRDVAARTP